MLSEIWSQILSWCPSVTDSEVNSRSSDIYAPSGAEADFGWRRRTGTSMPRAADTCRPGPLMPGTRSLDVTQAELVLVDLVHRDGEGLVLDGGVHERAHGVEEVPLVQVGVVVVDLTRARSEEHTYELQSL